MFKGMFHAHFGWLFEAEPAGLARAVPDLIADPILRFIDKFFWLWFLLGWIIHLWSIIDAARFSPRPQ